MNTLAIETLARGRSLLISSTCQPEQFVEAFISRPSSEIGFQMLAEDLRKTPAASQPVQSGTLPVLGLSVFSWGFTVSYGRFFFSVARFLPARTVQPFGP